MSILPVSDPEQTSKVEMMEGYVEGSEIIPAKNHECEATVIERDGTELTYIDLREFGDAVKGAVAQVAQTVELGREAINVIKADDVYVAAFSPEVQKGLKTGKYKINLRRKDGTQIGQVMERGKDGRYHFKELVTLENKTVTSAEARHRFLQDMNSFYLQQQMQTMAKELEDIHESVKRIEQGQEDDRVGKLIGGISTLRLALVSSDEDLLKHAIASLNEASGAIQKNLETRINRFERVPKALPGQIVKMFKTTDYIGKKVREYEDICEYFQFYEAAQRAIALASFLVCGEPALAEAMRTRRDFLKSVDMRNVATLRYLEPMACTEDDWLNHTEEYIERTDEALRLIATNERDAFEIELAGEQLLEAAENGYAEQPDGTAEAEAGESN